MKPSLLVLVLLLLLVLVSAVSVIGFITLDRRVEVVEEGDYILVDYSGRLEDGTVFDTSIEAVAIEAEIYNPGREYKPLGFTVGAGEMIEGFDRGVVGMAVGGERRLIIAYDEAYGAHCADRVMTIQIEELTTAGITPVAGKKIVTIHGHVGTIINVTDTDVVIDFNHELAGKTLVFDVKLISISRDGTDETI